jgi:hypothetical protein
MDQQTTETKGIYAGLSPADFVMRSRRPSLGKKLKDAAIREDQPGTPVSNTMKA